MKVQPNKENQETNSNDKISSKDSQDKSMCKNSSLLLMCKVVDLTGIPQDWKEAFQREFQKSYFQKLFQKVESSQKKDVVFPPVVDRFSFMSCPIKNVKVIIIGQDPYHGPNQAHGLAFSVKPGVKPPPSLVNIFKEIKSDLGTDFTIPNHGYLQGWHDQGVLLLNASLTVVQGKPNSHAKFGWAEFTDAIIKYFNKNHSNLVFLLWGGFAQKKALNCISTSKHHVLKAAHPSPLGANKGGWWNQKHFSKTNEYLKKHGKTPIDWNHL